ncbi:MAG: DNA-processing protein DprA [Firmicutes bacterium]|nr:DNA-processing protein DprA [Bacillota bacterium]
MKEVSVHHLYYWLSLCRVSPIRMAKLLEIYAPHELFERVKKDEKIGALTGEAQHALLKEYADADKLYASYDGLHKHGVQFLAFSDDAFPQRLKQREVCPPSGLYYKGDISLLNTTCLAIVGMRRCSHYGKENAFKFASELTDYNITVVSGLATGIDAFAHEAALKAGGKTIAVLGMGHANFYPADNQKLYQRICAEGLTVGEYPPQTAAAKYTFPERNRIISGLCDGVIIVEAAVSSGALITADRALEQGREVFAVPGPITSPKSAGTNALIQKGASLLSGTQDIINYFSYKNTKIPSILPALQLDFYEQKVYNLLVSGESGFDELIENSNLTASELLGVLTSMEVKDAIVRLPNNKYRVRN